MENGWKQNESLTVFTICLLYMTTFRKTPLAFLKVVVLRVKTELVDFLKSSKDELAFLKPWAVVLWIMGKVSQGFIQWVKSYVA